MNIKIDPNSTVAEVVKKNFQTAEIFKNHKIDFCCGGDKTIADVSHEKNISLDEFIKILNEKVNHELDRGHNYDEWDLDLLVDHILEVHHRYVKENIPLLSEFTYKIANVHGERRLELHTVYEYFGKVAQELQHHMMKEERVLFPYIKQLHEALKNESKIEESPFGSIRNPITMMESEHENAGNLLKQVRAITNDFSIPQDACNTYSVTLKKLEEFEDDLHQHIHLENNILFPNSIAVETKILGDN